MKKEKDRLHQYFSGHYSRKDLHFTQQLFTDSTQKENLQQNLEGHWDRFKLSPEQENKDLEPLLHKLHHQIHSKENTPHKKISFVYQLQRIAAILFIPVVLGIATYFWYDQTGNEQLAYAEIQCPDGTRTQFHLPDGSSGFLNNGSSIRYAVPFNKNREVLLSGEAFFDVAKNGHPFHVKTNNLDVQVMGTSFNVMAYEDDAIEEVILQTGKVKVSVLNGKKLATLRPNQQLLLNLDNNQYQINRVEASNFTAWREGKLIFRNEGLEAVAKRIERWYNVDIEITDESLKDYTFHATFMDHNLEEVLTLLTLTSPIKFEIEEQNNNSPGVYIKKKKVTLEPDITKTNKTN